MRLIINIPFILIFFLEKISNTSQPSFIEKAISPKQIYDRAVPTIIFEHKNCAQKTCSKFFAIFKSVAQKIFDTNPIEIDRFLVFSEYNNPNFKDPLLSDFLSLAETNLTRKSSIQLLKSFSIHTKFTSRLINHIATVNFRVLYYYNGAKAIYTGLGNSGKSLLRWVRKFIRQNHIASMDELQVQEQAKHHDIISVIREPVCIRLPISFAAAFSLSVNFPVILHSHAPWR